VDLVIGTVLLRPYVFGFLAAFLLAGAADVGGRRTALFAACVWPVALLAELSSTRTGVPFGLYHYTGSTRGLELFIADVPFMDSLSFTFLAYASFCLARGALGVGGGAPARLPARLGLAGLSGALMMLLDVVIDPAAVRGDRWFLGRIFYYPHGGEYFGVPLSNFLGWAIVGALGVGVYLALAGESGGRHVWPGIALYYAVLAFNLGVTAWIGEWTLVAVGATIHGAAAGVLRSAANRTSGRSGEPERGVESA
jgi:putative membrane protein